MKTLKKMALTSLLAAGFSGSVLAANPFQTIHVVGAPAIRQDSNNNITAYVATFTGGGLIATSASATDAASVAAANQNEWLIPNGVSTGTDLLINASWTGNTAGIESVANGSITQSFLTDEVGGGTVGSPAKVSFKTASNDTSYQPDFLLGDTFQGTTPFAQGTGIYEYQTDNAQVQLSFNNLTRTTLAVEPYVFVASPGAQAAGLTNITTDQAQELFAKGALPLAYFTGNNSDESKWVYALTRDPGSGSRLILQAVTGIGVNTLLKTYQPTVSGGTTDSAANNVNGTIASYTAPSGANPVPLYGAGEIASTQIWDDNAGDTGYPSFGGSTTGLLAAITATPPANALFVTYFNTVDGSEATGTALNPNVTLPTPLGDAQVLNYNGIPYSAANVAEGKYSFWSYQSVFTPSGLATSNPKANTLATWLIAHWTATYGLATSTLNVHRLSDGGQLIHNY